METLLARVFRLKFSICREIALTFLTHPVIVVIAVITTLLLQWWVNEFISWDPDQCGTDKIALPRDKFWMPDIVINEL